jgi:hypothetical protein
MKNRYSDCYNKDNNLANMPEEYLGMFYNACTEPCDMLQGPCVCGATHHQEEWPEWLQLEVFGNYKKYDGPMPWPREPLNLMPHQKKYLANKIVILQKQIDKYEKALFVIRELAICAFEDTIAAIVDSLDIPKLSEKEFREYLKNFKEQNNETNN